MRSSGREGRRRGRCHWHRRWRPRGSGRGRVPRAIRGGCRSTAATCLRGHALATPAMSRGAAFAHRGHTRLRRDAVHAGRERRPGPLGEHLGEVLLVEPRVSARRQRHNSCSAVRVDRVDGTPAPIAMSERMDVAETDALMGRDVTIAAASSRRGMPPPSRAYLSPDRTSGPPLGIDGGVMVHRCGGLLSVHRGDPDGSTAEPATQMR